MLQSLTQMDYRRLGAEEVPEVADDTSYFIISKKYIYRHDFKPLMKNACFECSKMSMGRKQLHLDSYSSGSGRWNGGRWGSWRHWRGRKWKRRDSLNEHPVGRRSLDGSDVPLRSWENKSTVYNIIIKQLGIVVRGPDCLTYLCWIKIPL